MNISVATLSYVSLLQLLSIQYQKKHMKYSVIWKKYHLEHGGASMPPVIFVLSTMKGAAKP